MAHLILIFQFSSHWILHEDEFQLLFYVSSDIKNVDFATHTPHQVPEHARFVLANVPDAIGKSSGGVRIRWPNLGASIVSASRGPSNFAFNNFQMLWSRIPFRKSGIINLLFLFSFRRRSHLVETEKSVTMSFGQCSAPAPLAERRPKMGKEWMPSEQTSEAGILLFLFNC